MLKASAYKTGCTLIGVSALLVACASAGTHEEAKTEVDQAHATLTDFLRDPEMTWLQKNMKNAKGILISPQIVQAGFIVGGSGGSAVLLAREGNSQKWAGPAFYKLATGSLGLQAGAQSSEMVALVMNEKTLNSLLSSSVKLGGDVSIAAGPIGAGAGAPIAADMVAFTRSKGLYGGLNLTGTVISIDDQSNKSFYGQPANPVDILVKQTVSNPYGHSLTQLAANPGIASGASTTSGSSHSGAQ